MGLINGHIGRIVRKYEIGQKNKTSARPPTEQASIQSPQRLCGGPSCRHSESRWPLASPEGHALSFFFSARALVRNFFGCPPPSDRTTRIVDATRHAPAWDGRATNPPENNVGLGGAHKVGLARWGGVVGALIITWEGAVVEATVCSNVCVMRWAEKHGGGAAPECSQGHGAI